MHKGIAVIMLAVLAMVSFIPRIAGDTQIQVLSVRMRGFITQWGETQVFGWIAANAKKVNINGTEKPDFAMVHAMWSNDKPRLNCTKPPENGTTFSFYIAKLVPKTEMVKLNYSGYNFYISGLWNVVNITTTIYVDENGGIINVTRVLEPLLTNATGELRVFDHWKHFELAIDGIDMLSGFVFMWRIAYTEIKMCDLNDDDKVDLIDIVHVARAYKAVPGMPGYKVEMDFDFNYRIDLGDLTTLAANTEG
jgi:hypothetical protein